MTVSQTTEHHAIGPLLRGWRMRRKLSQLQLAMEADVSSRHVSFIETGRAKPSREMVLTLAAALDVPLRERNTFLASAGFAPVYRESDLAAPELASVRTALTFFLEHHNPFPALVIDSHWNILMANESSGRLTAALVDPVEIADLGTPNLLTLIFDPRGLRSCIANWDEVAKTMIERAHREVINGSASESLLSRIFSYPDVPRDWRKPELDRPIPPTLPVIFEGKDLRVSLFSALTTLGTPQDVTLQELQIESFFPADPESEAVLRQLAEAPA